MDPGNYGLAILSMVFWGVGSFVAKLATNRIGDRAVFWDLLGYGPAILMYSLVVFRSRDLFSADRGGAILAVAAGAIGSMGLVLFYVLLSKKEASAVVPLTAMYPILTAILAFIFLKEQITVAKTLGIIFSVVALILLGL